jgi:hypothetical protein
LITTYSPLRPTDVAAATSLHRRALLGFFLTSLGEPFPVEFTTDADDNASTLRFYESCGWRRTASFSTAEGRRMHRYDITLEARE